MYVPTKFVFVCLHVSLMVKATNSGEEAVEERPRNTLASVSLSTITLQQTAVTPGSMSDVLVAGSEIPVMCNCVGKRTEINSVVGEAGNVSGENNQLEHTNTWNLATATGELIFDSGNENVQSTYSANTKWVEGISLGDEMRNLSGGKARLYHQTGSTLTIMTHLECSMEGVRFDQGQPEEVSITSNILSQASEKDNIDRKLDVMAPTGGEKEGTISDGAIDAAFVMPCVTQGHKLVHLTRDRPKRSARAPSRGLHRTSEADVDTTSVKPATTDNILMELPPLRQWHTEPNHTEATPQVLPDATPRTSLTAELHYMLGLPKWKRFADPSDDHNQCMPVTSNKSSPYTALISDQTGAILIPETKPTDSAQFKSTAPLKTLDVVHTKTTQTTSSKAMPTASMATLISELNHAFTLPKWRKAIGISTAEPADEIEGNLDTQPLNQQPTSVPSAGILGREDNIEEKLDVMAPTGIDKETIAVDVHAAEESPTEKEQPHLQGVSTLQLSGLAEAKTRTDIKDSLQRMWCDQVQPNVSITASGTPPIQPPERGREVLPIIEPTKQLIFPLSETLDLHVHDYPKAADRSELHDWRQKGRKHVEKISTEKKNSAEETLEKRHPPSEGMYTASLSHVPSQQEALITSKVIITTHPPLHMYAKTGEEANTHFSVCGGLEHAETQLFNNKANSVLSQVSEGKDNVEGKLDIMAPTKGNEVHVHEAECKRPTEKEEPHLQVVSTPQLSDLAEAKTRADIKDSLQRMRFDQVQPEVSITCSVARGTPPDIQPSNIEVEVLPTIQSTLQLITPPSENLNLHEHQTGDLELCDWRHKRGKQIKKIHAKKTSTGEEDPSQGINTSSLPYAPSCQEALITTAYTEGTPTTHTKAITTPPISVQIEPVEDVSITEKRMERKPNDTEQCSGDNKELRSPGDGDGRQHPTENLSTEPFLQWGTYPTQATLGADVTLMEEVKPDEGEQTTAFDGKICLSVGGDVMAQPQSAVLGTEKVQKSVLSMMELPNGGEESLDEVRGLAKDTVSLPVEVKSTVNKSIVVGSSQKPVDHPDPTEHEGVGPEGEEPSSPQHNDKFNWRRGRLVRRKIELDEDREKLTPQPQPHMVAVEMSVSPIHEPATQLRPRSGHVEKKIYSPHKPTSGLPHLADLETSNEDIPVVLGPPAEVPARQHLLQTKRQDLT